ncbi:MAG: hypothetical protein H7318_14040 [Oligoflexus sp.]|nr:hypothetical protein [Oligoflexus sp.]
MNSKFKSKAMYCLLCVSCFLSSCWGKQKASKNTPNFGFFKTSDAEQACVSTNVSQWELNAKFLHNFLSCASNKSVDGKETLSGIQNLLAKLDEAKMQKLLDFVLTVDPKGATHEERYPYLLAATTLLDRGLVDGKVAGLNLAGERLGRLQDFLVSLDATKTKDILSTWSRSGHLAEILNEFGAFVDQLEDNSLESATHELLSGSKLKPEFLYLARRLLKEDLLFTNLSEILAKKSAQVLSPPEQLKLLAPYRESLTASDTQALQNVKPAVKTETTALAEFSKLHEQYTPTELQGLSSFLLSYWKSYQNLGEDERVSLDARFADSMNSILGQQAHSAKWMLALLRDASQLKAKDLDSSTIALDQLLLEGANLSLEAIRFKSGASKLMYQLQLLLTHGGKVPGCSFFDKPALSGEAEFKDLSLAINNLSRPQSDCGGRVPLVAAIESITGAAITTGCVDQLVCLEENSPLATSQELWNQGDADPVLTKKLTLEAIAQLRQLTTEDPYTLYNLQLALDRIDLSLLDDLQKRLSNSTDWSLEGLAQLDDGLSHEYAGRLQNDFIEKLLTYRIETLASQTFQFADLAPETVDQIDASLEARSSRIFAGLYTDGPAESLMRLKSKFDLSHFAFTEDQLDLKKYLETHPSIWSRIIFKAKQADGIFRTPASGSLAGENVVTFSGPGSSLKNYLGFEAIPAAQLQAIVSETTSHRILQPMQTTRLFSDDDQGHSNWSIWAQHYAYGPLVAKDVPAELSKKLQDWFLMSFIPTVSDDSFWNELASTGEQPSASVLSSDFFNVVPYTPEEARLISTYYLRQYQKISPTLPLPPAVAFGKSSAPKTDVSAFADPIRGFFNTSYLVRDDFEAQYTVYAKYFAKSLRSGSKVSELKNGVLPDYAGFNSQIASWKFAEIAPVNDPFLLVDDTESPMALLSSLNLLTFSKPQSKFIPQSLVGFSGKLCRSKVKDAASATVWIETPTACPLDFQGASEEEAYDKFRDYVGTEAVQSLCPLLASDNFGPRMTWSQRLGLTLDDQALCKNTASLMEAYRFPAWHSSKVLNDIFVMGRKATLKAGLVQVPSGIRFYKLKHKGLTPDRLVSEWLQQGKGVWSARNAADQRRREYFAGSFWVGSPNLLNAYLNLLSQHLDAFSWRVVLIAYAERDDKGQQNDTLRDIIRLFSTEQKLAAANGEDGFTFALTMIDKIVSNKDYRQFLTNFASHLNSSEAYNFYSKELPLALIELFPEDQNPFDWMDPGLHFSKFLAQHSSLKTLQALNDSFSPAELDRFLVQTNEALQTIPDIKDRVGLLAKLSSETVQLATLYIPDEATQLTEGFENLVATWSHLSLGDDFKQQWTTLVSNFSLPLEGLNGEKTISGETLLESVVSASVKRGPALFAKIQEASDFAEPLFWRNWAASFLATIDDSGDGALAMANFVAQKRFQLSEGKLWIDILHSSDLQNKAILALEAVDSVPENIWREAIEEGADISSRLVKAFSYLRSHLEWKVDPDHNAYRIALDQLFELSQDQNLRDKQLELVTLWLNGDKIPDTQSEIKK